MNIVLLTFAVPEERRCVEFIRLEIVLFNFSANTILVFNGYITYILNSFAVRDKFLAHGANPGAVLPVMALAVGAYPSFATIAGTQR